MRINSDYELKNIQIFLLLTISGTLNNTLYGMDETEMRNKDYLLRKKYVCSFPLTVYYYLLINFRPLNPSVLLLYTNYSIDIYVDRWQQFLSIHKHPKHIKFLNALDLLMVKDQMSISNNKCLFY